MDVLYYRKALVGVLPLEAVAERQYVAALGKVFAKALVEQPRMAGEERVGLLGEVLIEELAASLKGSVALVWVEPSRLRDMHLEDTVALLHAVCGNVELLGRKRKLKSSKTEYFKGHVPF